MNIFEKQKLRLTIKSPVHIGSVEQKITPFEYIEHKGYVYHLSEEKLSEFLLNTKLLNLYLNRVQNEGHRFRIHAFLKEHNISLSENKLLHLSNSRKAKLKTNALELTEYRPFIRDAFNKVYIPGTSVKGAIRTAILYHSLKEFKTKNPAGFSTQVEQRIIKDIDERKNKKFFFQWAIKKWLEGFVLGNKERSPNTDWLRMLHVSDAYPVSPIETIVIPINILKKENTWTYKKERSGKTTTIWVEAIPKNIEFEFEVTGDTRLLEDFKRTNKNIMLPDDLQKIYDIVTHWAEDIFNFERKFLNGCPLRKWYETNNANFRVGFGSGMISTTILMLLEPDTRKKVRNYSGQNRELDEAPKSRRVWSNNNSLIPLGWAVLEVKHGSL